MAYDLELDLVTPRKPDARGGSSMLRLPDTLPAPEVLASLRDSGVYGDNRSQTLRFSPGFMTTAEGTERLIEGLGTAIRK
jgi:kynureninase